MHIILLSKTNLKRIKLTNFFENFKNENSRVLEKFGSIHQYIKSEANRI